MRLPETAIEVTEADDGDLFLRVLDEALDALHTADIPFLLIGGIGSAVYGRDQARGTSTSSFAPRRPAGSWRCSGHVGSRRRKSPSGGCRRR
jgi:hypothetical protein